MGKNTSRWVGMQIYSTNRSITAGKGPEGGKRSLQGRDFASQLSAVIQKNSIQPTSAPQNPVSLGRISTDQPTVSHLLVGHADYGRECWQIIHSQHNDEKPYRRIPEGTEIFLDPATQELFWETRPGMEPSPKRSHQVRPQESCNKIQNPLADRHPAERERERELIQQAVSSAASRYDLSPELIFSVIRAESDFNVQAVSRAGAQGLMQLMPATARELGVDKPFDIFQNIEGGARYLKKMLRLFGDNLEKALAAYNAGPGTVKRFNGQVPYEETRQYVARIMSYMAQKPG